MKKKMLVVLCIVLALLTLSACGKKKNNAETVTVAPVETAAPAQPATAEPAPAETPAGGFAITPTSLPAPAQEPVPTLAPASAQTPAPTPAPAPTQAPTPAPTAKPASSNLPVIKKNPTGETVNVGGKCQFVTRYENAKWAVWHFVSPDGSRDIDYLQAGEAFPTLKIIDGYGKDMTLDKIPAELNGWKVYCRFINDAGSADSEAALITIKGQPTPTPAVPQRQGFEGRWAEEIAGRCQLTMTYRAEGSMNVTVTWSSSAWQRACWTMTADVYKNDILIYEDGHYWVETFSDDTHFTVSDESFNGTGSFYLQDGKLHWVNDQTQTETVLIPA